MPLFDIICMKHCLVIQSISDLITNSSSEVFLYNTSDDLKRFFKETHTGANVIHFDTIEDVKRMMDKDHEWECEGIFECGLIDTPSYWPSMLATLEDHKTYDEIFEFFKYAFEGLVGKTVVTIDNNWSSEMTDSLSYWCKENNIKRINPIEHDSY